MSNTKIFTSCPIVIESKGSIMLIIRNELPLIHFGQMGDEGVVKRSERFPKMYIYLLTVIFHMQILLESHLSAYFTNMDNNKSK